MSDEAGDGDVLLHAEFGARRRESRARYALTLTRAALHAQPLPPAAARDPSRRLLVPIDDIVGCHALRHSRPKSTSSQPSPSPPSPSSPAPPASSTSQWAYVTVFAYPRGGGTGKGPRSSTRHTFRIDSHGDADGNIREARRWETAILSLLRGERSPSGLPPRRRRLLILVNPFSGTKKAQLRCQRILHPMMEEADMQHHTIITERAGHASTLVQQMDLSEWDGIVIVSGDGLLFEVINGLMSRPDWKDAIRIPLGIFPCGSGNALAGSINHYTGHDMVMGDVLAQHLAFLLCRGGVTPLDLVSVRFASGRRLFSFLSVAWGFVSDVDIESERFRAMGPARFTLGAIVRLLSLRSYPGRLSFLPAEAAVGKRSLARSLTTAGTRVADADADVAGLRRQMSDLGPCETGAGNVRDVRRGAGEEAGRKGAAPDEILDENRNGHGGGGGADDDAAAVFGSSDVLERLGNNPDETNHRGTSDREEGRAGTGSENDVGGSGAGGGGISTGANNPSLDDDDDVFDGANRGTAEPGEPTSEPGRTSRPDRTANSFVDANGGDVNPLGPEDDLLPPLDEPVPPSWVTLEGDFVLVLGLYQSHLGADLATVPAARADDGVIHLRAVRRGAPRAALVRLLFGAGGEAEPEPALAPFLTAERVRAFRLRPLGKEGGIVTVDGERLPCEALQAQVHPGIANVMGLRGAGPRGAV
ncbi:sphingosine kinase 2-like isoform X1 [Lethenteron reissneri]|uniref:sphingosine kinase 2-like isoform X1 n=1 Tax=Lethenteron reissneri TaxID=7753 RepID=UPI002AB7393B|nr:sphingosine kinase 2-like isoform X1 [Lethenteron reissneri]